MWHAQGRRRRRFSFKKRLVILSFSIVFLVVLFVFWFLRFFTYQRSLIIPIPEIKSENKADLPGEITAYLRKFKIPFSSVSIASHSSYIVKLQSGQEVILSAKKSILAQVSSLQLILARLTIEGKSFSRLDFSFNRPVIVFK